MDDPANPNNSSQDQNITLNPANPNSVVPGSDTQFGSQQSTNPFPTNNSLPTTDSSLNVPTSQALNTDSPTSTLTEPNAGTNPNFPSPTTSINPPPLDTNPLSPDLSATNLNIPPTGAADQPFTPTSADQLPPAQPLPTFTPEQPADQSNQPASSAISSTTPIIGSIDTTQTTPTPTAETTEPAPTDLSQLTGNNSQPNSDVYSPSVSAPESLVVPSSATAQPTPAAVSTTTATRHTLPLIAIIGAVIVILLVAGASAYFILGVGKTAQQPSTSLPIVQQQAPLTKPPSQTPAPTLASQQAATGSAQGQGSFGNLNGDTNTPAATKGPTSAADLLKAKQSSSPSASPKL